MQRRCQLRVGGHLGLDGELGRLEWRALGADAILGAEAFEVQSAAGIRPDQIWRDRSIQSRREERQMESGAGLALTRYESRRTAGDRERNRLRLRQWGRHESGGVRHRTRLQFRRKSYQRL